MIKGARYLALMAAIAAGCGSRVEPAAPVATPAAVAVAEPLLVGESPVVHVTAPAELASSETQVFVDDQLLGQVGTELRLEGLKPGRHILRFRLPGCETKDVLIVVDPASREQTVRVSLEPAMGTDPNSPFVYDLY